MNLFVSSCAQHMRVDNSNITLRLSNFIDKTCELIDRELFLFWLGLRIVAKQVSQAQTENCCCYWVL